MSTIEIILVAKNILEVVFVVFMGTERNISIDSW